MSDITTFKRKEIKYLLDEKEYQNLKLRLSQRLVADEHGKSEIRNIYYDTPDFELIRRSLEKPIYKEKLRVRSYGVPDENDPVFVELKKKYKGIVYKRREALALPQAEAYLAGGIEVPKDTQIMREIDWFLSYYNDLVPAMSICYDREAYYSVEDASVRITFDNNIRWRSDRLSLADGAFGRQLLEPGQHLMELKVGGAMPLWLTGLLDALEIYPVSFSKYGKAYLEKCRRKNTVMLRAADKMRMAAAV